MTRRLRSYSEGFTLPEVGEFFDDMFRNISNRVQATHALWTPMADVFETEEYVLVTFELPGIDRESVELTYADDQLTVRGVRRRRHLSKEHVCRLMEIEYGPFERSVRLGSPVNVSQVRASYEDGFLEVTLPRIVESRRRTIRVKID